MAEWTDDRIIAGLAVLRDELRVPDEPLRVAPARPARRHPWAAAAAVVAVALILGVAIAPARRAVADWLGIGSTEVRTDPGHAAPPAGLPTLADGAVAVDADAAAAELGRPLPPVGRADAAAPQYAIPAEGGVLVRWPGRGETLWVHPGADRAVGFFTKFASADATIERVDDLGDQALWLGDSHVLETPGRALAARHVLLWVDDGLELRLEGDGTRDEMVGIARHLQG
jgi:hypothetical protein